MLLKSQHLSRLPWIDALRGLAFFGVLFYHVGIFTKDLPPVLGGVIEFGQSGVQLFYIISAFTLFLSIRNRRGKEVAPLRNFFIRRFFRIAPLFYCVIAYYLVRYGIGPSLWQEDGNSITLANIFAHITFLNGCNPYWINSLVAGGWSVAIEMPFYLLVPFLFKYVKTVRAAVQLTLSLFILSKALSFVLKKYILVGNIDLWQGFLYYWLPNQLPFFGMGIILYFLILERESRQTKTSQFFLLWRFLKVMSPLLLVGLSLTTFSLISKVNVSAILLFQTIIFVLLAIFLNASIFPVLVNQFWCYLGRISYSGYLLHFELHPLARKQVMWLASLMDVALPPLTEFLLTLAIALAMTVALASLTYEFIEKPGMMLGKRLIEYSDLKLGKTKIRLK